MTRILAIGMATLILFGSSPRAGGREAVATDPLADNAALAYWQAFALLPELKDEQAEALQEALSGQGPIDAALADLVESNGDLMGELHRGARHARCAWGTALDEGPLALLTHLPKARQLAKFACLRMRLRFDRKRADEAIDDWTATMTLGRHVGGQSLVISLLVQYAIEKPAIEIVARYLPTFEPETLDRIAERLQDLPKSKTMMDGVRAEKEYLLDWFIRKFSEPGGKEDFLRFFENQEDPNIVAIRELSDAELKETGIKLRPVYDELGKLMTLPPDELDEKVKQEAARPEWQGSVKHLGGLILPAVVAARRTEAVHQTRLDMLKAAIAVARDGKGTLDREDLRDPFGDGPFEYVAAQDGFELRSKLVDRKGSQVMLTVGGLRKQEP